jgi:hypothetical protein
MAMTDEALSLEQLNKGSYRGYMRYGTTLELWFSSPTGDDSDSVVFKMQCETPEQAAEIAAMHQRVWGHL